MDMDTESLTTRLNEAVLTAQSDGGKALRALARALKDEGMSQQGIYEVFDHLRAQHETDLTDAVFDCILATLDFIWGWGPKPFLFKE
jgi:hypothetical protein